MKPIAKSSKKFEEVLQAIRDDIVKRNLQPGDRLLPEREMSEALQVSRASVREALRVLEIFDVIQSKPGEGTTLKKPEVAAILAKFYPFYLMPETTIVELMEARIVLEGGVARLAAERRSIQDLANMREAVEQMRSERLDDQMRAEYLFHTALSQAAGNKTLTDILYVLTDMFANVLQASRLWMYQLEDVVETMYQQHYDIVEAIAAQDGNRAQQALERNIRFAVEKLKTSAASEANKTVKEKLKPRAKKPKQEME